MTIVSIILTLTLVASSSQAIAFAATATPDISLAKERAEMFLSNVGHPADVTDAVLLKNLNGEYEAVSFSTSEGGYIIVNLNDMSVPELSPTSPNPYAGYTEAYYNGALAHFYEKDGEIVSVEDGAVVDLSKVDYVYEKEKVDNIDSFKTTGAARAAVATRAVNTEKYLSGKLQNWYIPAPDSSDQSCGAYSSAVCMR